MPYPPVIQFEEQALRASAQAQLVRELRAARRSGDQIGTTRGRLARLLLRRCPEPALYRAESRCR